MNIPDEIIEARSLLEDAEKEINPKRKVDKLKEGIELMDLYVEENSNISEDTKTNIENMRRSHTRRLLSQLVSIEQIEIEIWLDYIILLITKLKKEKDYSIENDPELKKNYDNFYSVYSEELNQALKGFKK